MRGIVFVVTIVMVMAAVAIRWMAWQGKLPSDSILVVGWDPLVRLIVVLAAALIAWPVVRKPALWLAPGMSALLLVVIGVCAVRPRLAVVLLPAVGLLIAFSGVVRLIRNA